MSAAEKATLLGSIKIVDRHDHFSAAYEALGGSIYHQPRWLAAFEVYGLRTHWLVAQRDGTPIGILPLVRQSSSVFGHRLISLPWVDEAGALGEDDAVQALLEHATHLARESGSKFSLIVKQPINQQHFELSQGWSICAHGKVLLRRRLSMSADELWKELSAKVRNQVRKAEKNGLTTEQGGEELLDDFYGVYSRNMRDLGSPAHSLRFFERVLEAVGDQASIYCTRLEGKVVGAGVVFANCSSLDTPWASSLRAYNPLCVNHALYWRILSDACSRGYQWFHFGRSTAESGQYRFKKQWGAETAPLPWLHFLPAAKRASETHSAALQERFGLAQRVWSKLPLRLSRLLGPYVIRHAP